MKTLAFVTTNPQKFAMGHSICQDYGIRLLQTKLDIDEVQSEDTEYVARRKAEAANHLTGAPVITSDDAWEIHGLKGFPGTYAKSVNEWFSPADYLNLTRDLEDRTTSFIQTLVFQDDDTQQLFVQTTPGTLLKEARGDSGVSIQAIISLEPGGNQSIAEMISDASHYKGESALAVWHNFARWYQANR
jgi:non-canonical purine NTP pyrophosphatase (RdgB/HAM1 family)